MASPLSPAHDALLNSANSMTKRKYDDYDKIAGMPRRGSVGGHQQAVPMSSTAQDERAAQAAPSRSSPSVLHAGPNATAPATALDQENPSPARTINRASRVMTAGEMSPLRMGEGLGMGRSRPSASVDLGSRGLRKMASERRFPVKGGASAGDDDASGRSALGHERTTSLDDRAAMENEGGRRRRAAGTFSEEDELSALDREADLSASAADGSDPSPGDESVMSTFSTFSAVPGMTMFAKLGHSPSKLSSGLGSGMTPRRSHTLSSASSTSSPLKSSIRPRASQADMLDFSSSRSGPASPPPPPARATPRASQTPATRGQLDGGANLLDFDISPAPTPRSIPSITPRELESLKSRFLSEISSLKASLSGKEAEVDSLKTAVGDAEKRVGRSLEQLREERASRDQLKAERDRWETRGQEMESMLRKIKEELKIGQREREDLEKQLDESEKRRESAEIAQQEAETKLGSLRGNAATTNSNSSSHSHSNSVNSNSSSSEKAAPAGPSGSTSREVEIAVERVARELHTLYKSKHETKVAALKRSYENKWEKKVRALEMKLNEASAENERLREKGTALAPGPEATIARFDEMEAQERKAQAVRDSAAIKELTANVQRAEAVASCLERDNQELRNMLQQERLEKGELVQLAEELMGMQQTLIAGTSPPRTQQEPPSRPQPQPQPQPQSQQAQPQAQAIQMPPADTMPAPRPAHRPAPAARSSGLRAPGASGLRAPASMAKLTSLSSSSSTTSFSASTSSMSSFHQGGLPRPGARSGGIMGSIEKMGNYRGRAE